MKTGSIIQTVADDNEFRVWMKAMGFNSKQVSAAGETIGMSPSLAGHSSRGVRELTQTERLAMAAATAGIPPWTPEAAAEIEAVQTLYTLLKGEIAQAAAGSGAEVEALRTIRAVIRSEALRIATEAQMEKAAAPETDQAILALLRAAVQGANAR